MMRVVLLALPIGWVLTAAAAAQDRPQAGGQRCAPIEGLARGESNPAPPSSDSRNLSDRLSRSGGVLCPPDVDPAIKKPAPETGKTPVIPPPGSPGGDPAVRPK